MRDISEWMPKDGESVVCGVSGGVDSMVLLELLRAHGGGVVAAHYNHHLRPTASRDENFVRDWCTEHGIPFVSGGGDVSGYAAREGLSIEEAARKLRYDFLRREAVSRRIYVAHHAGDNAETILWNLIRGTGLRGLSGMSHEQGGIVRPLLDVPRAEIEAYAAAHGIPHVEDESNTDPDAASRNLLRLQVMPLLKRLNPRVEEHLCAAGGRAALLHASAEAEARRHMQRAEARTGFAAIPVRDLSATPPELRPLILLDLLERIGAGRKDVGAVHLRAALGLLDAGERVDLPHGVTASVRDGWLLLETRPATLGERVLIPGTPLRWGAYELTLLPGDCADGGGLPCDSADGGGDGIAIRATREKVSVRPCPPGERLTVPGSPGSRTLKRLCVDRRISLRERDTLPAFYVGGRLAAVWRIGPDAAFVPDTPERLFIRVREREISSLWEMTENFTTGGRNL
ncbi:MAG: tRNA lysidine(34) synthetase TilS [Oscillibacter sp.]|nr:tRNA lysidine(34) synthetase TilS [Oscillibacter sp.]